MKNFLGKRLVSLLLALVMVFGLVPVLATPKVEAEAIDYASLKAEIQAFKYPGGFAMHYDPTTAGNIDGIYMVVATQGGNKQTGDYFHTINHSIPRNQGAFVGFDTIDTIKVDSQMLIGDNRDCYSFIKGSVKSFSIQRIDRTAYWKFEDISGEETYAALLLKSGDSNNKFYLDNSTESGRYHIIRDTARNRYLHSNSHTYRASYAQYPQKLADETQFWLCKVNEEAFYLRDALQAATTYLIDNSSG